MGRTRIFEASSRAGKKLVEGFRQSELAQRVFDADFPQRGGTYEDRVFRVLNTRESLGTELAAAREKPKQRMSIQQ